MIFISLHKYNIYFIKSLHKYIITPIMIFISLMLYTNMIFIKSIFYYAIAVTQISYLLNSCAVTQIIIFI